MAARDVGELGTILGVWAHPDDDSYLSGGIMASAVRNGQRVVCVTATRGEEGSTDHAKWPPAEMGRIRQAEMERSLSILGVTEHHWLDYHDGAVSSIDFEEGVATVKRFVDEVRPSTVLTFGPDGMTGHPDHRAVGAWTDEAFERAARPGASLYHAVQTKAWTDRWVAGMNESNVFMEAGTPPVVPEEDLAINVELPDDVLDLKMEAIQAHVSQVGALFAIFGRRGMREAMAAERFALGATR
jgi:LmbE family N-acetylglucosaminyl deacetylase